MCCKIGILSPVPAGLLALCCCCAATSQCVTNDYHHSFYVRLQVELTDLPSGAAAALEADVFVGLHGANLQNSMFLQPGGSVVEVVPFQYDKSPWGHALAQFNMAVSLLEWWQVLCCRWRQSNGGWLKLKWHSHALIHASIPLPPLPMSAGPHHSAAVVEHRGLRRQAVNAWSGGG